jgi:glycosyltransferase involved in cell wall biosynthesis
MPRPPTANCQLRMTESIIIISPGFASDEEDTSCLPMQQAFVKALQQQYPQVKIIVLALQYPFKKGSYDWFGNEIIAFNGKEKGKLYRLLTWWRVWKTLKRLHVTTTIRGLFSFWYGECFLLGHHFAKLNRLLHYGWILGQDAKKNNPYTRRVRPNGGELIALSDFLQDEFERNYQVRPKYVIPAGIDASLFKTPVAKDIDIMSAGSLIPLKQYHLLVDIIAAIKQQQPGLKAILAGTGPEQQRLQQQIDSLGLQENFQLTGRLSYPEVLATMQRSKIFLHPSSYEGFSGVCLEALAAGASVISFTQPMKVLPPDWYVVKSKEEMIALTVKLLNQPAVASSFTGYTIDNTAKQVGKLFLESVRL